MQNVGVKSCHERPGKQKALDIKGLATICLARSQNSLSSSTDGDRSIYVYCIQYVGPMHSGDVDRYPPCMLQPNPSQIMYLLRGRTIRRHTQRRKNCTEEGDLGGTELH
jgi:hypothetical protein